VSASVLPRGGRTEGTRLLRRVWHETGREFEAASGGKERQNVRRRNASNVQAPAGATTFVQNET
jgi:hypothetical protein